MMDDPVTQAVVIAVVGALAVGVVSAVTGWLSRLILAIYRVVFAELTANGGASMRDRQERIERQNEAIAEAVGELATEVRRQNQEARNDLRVVHQRIDEVLLHLTGQRIRR